MGNSPEDRPIWTKRQQVLHCMKQDQETKFNLLIPPINPSNGEEGHWQLEGGHKVDKTFPHHTFAKLGGVKYGMRGH